MASRRRSSLLPVSEGDDVVCTPTTLLAVNVGYEIGEKKILAEVDAIFEPRKLTALMGSSGAGKTTLLNTLAGRAPGQSSGEILVNGTPTTPKKMRLLLSYMPQDDVLYLQLTVRQSLYYAALMRCPREWSGSAKRDRAEAVMEKLGLDHVANNYLSAVSGGQRKRVSAALEFLSNRPLLFMDEPTSGLDAATAKALVDTLRDAAHDEARTVISTIHQPSWTLLTKFDTVVLLGTRRELGGTVVYHGPPDQLPKYFGTRGSPVPADTNPADHLMYVLKDQGADKWADSWKSSELAAVLVELTRRERLLKRPDTLPTDDGADDSSYAISHWEQYRVLLARTTHLWIFDRQQGPLILKLLFATNLQIVLLLAGMTPNLSKANTILYFTVTQYTMATTPLVILMPLEKAVILREYRNGVFSAPIYWLARASLVIAHATVVAMFTTVFTYPLAGFARDPFPAKFFRWFFAQLLYNSTIMLFGLAIGVNSPTAMAGLKGTTAVLVPWIASTGVTPPLSMVREPMNFFHYPNPMSWAVKLSLTIGFTNRGEKARRTLHDGLKVHAGDANSCYWALAICFGVVFFAGLRATHKVLTSPDASAGQRASKRPEQDGTATEQPDESSSTTTPLVEASSYGATEEAIVRHPVPIELRSVSYYHPPQSEDAPPKMAIGDVSVNFGAGTATVLMGPSGAGKTSMLHLLSGRLAGGSYTTEDGRVEPCLRGQILVDGKPTALAAFKRLGTVTPQDDVLNEILTVHQTLAFTAELRLPPDWSYSRKMVRVDAVIRELGLEHSKHNVVGTTLKVGISGGQKKRLSIAVDLLAELPIMLVDEPTTGLDAASALDVCERLVSLAKEENRTVICTVHQPPWSTVLKFDRLVVLNSGRLVFNEPPAGLETFLASHQCAVPTNENPADHLMHVLVNQQAIAVRQEPSSPTSIKPPLFAHSTGDDDDGADESYAVSEFTQYRVLLRRFSYVFVVDPDQLAEMFFPGCVISIFNGLAFRNFGVNKYLGGALLYNIIAHSMISSNGTVLNIPSERDLVLREYRNGTFSVRAYWCARISVSTWAAVILGVPWIAIWYSLTGLPGEIMPILHTYLSSTLNALVLAAIAGVVGLVCQTELAAGQVFTPIGDSMTIYAGLLIAKRFIKPYMLPFYYGFPISWAYENVASAVLEHKGDDGEAVMKYYSIHASNRPLNYLVLACMVVFWFLVGLALAKSKIAGLPTTQHSRTKKFDSFRPDLFACHLLKRVCFWFVADTRDLSEVKPIPSFV